MFYHTFVLNHPRGIFLHHTGNWVICSPVPCKSSHYYHHFYHAITYTYLEEITQMQGAISISTSYSKEVQVQCTNNSLESSCQYSNNAVKLIQEYPSIITCPCKRLYETYADCFHFLYTCLTSYTCWFVVIVHACNT